MEISEKLAFLILYAASVSVAIAIFLYCTIVMGLKVNNFQFVAAVTILIPAIIAITGSVVILNLKLE